MIVITGAPAACVTVIVLEGALVALTVMFAVRAARVLGAQVTVRLPPVTPDVGTVHHAWSLDAVHPVGTLVVTVAGLGPPEVTVVPAAVPNAMVVALTVSCG